LLSCYLEFLEEYVELEKSEWSLLGFADGMQHLRDYPFNRRFAPSQFSANDLESFCKKMPHYSSPYEERFQEGSLESIMGCYLSFLADVCSGDELNLNLKSFPEVCNMGYHNRKKVNIKGHVGYGFGNSMTAGILRIEGFVNGGLGDYMEGGRIEVYGNATGDICQEMKSGEVYIKGDLMDDWGGDGSFNCMAGGKVTIDGNFNGVIGGICGGEVYLNGDFTGKFTDKIKENDWKFLGANIYHQGKLIVRDGRMASQ